MPSPKNKSLILIYLMLAAGVLLVFWQIKNFDFINFDDDVYVYENPHVLNGLTFDSVKWAFTTFHAANWHPLTWLSLMLDSELFGPQARTFHLVNLFFHIANVLLLFTLLKNITSAIWQSLFVSAVFALHPLHVESVAWVAERKDVLSTFFFLIAIFCYVRYVRRRRIFNYLLLVLFFSLGLMSKPMVVTLPFVLLLLDYWPLHRFDSKDKFSGLFVEKIPLFAFSAVSSIITFLAQRHGGAVRLEENIGFPVHLANAAISYVQYIFKMFWPARLAIFYPHPAQNISYFYAVLSACFLLAITIFVIRFARNNKYLFTGWFWFIGTLVPVIGLVQAGGQANADRYTYIPLTGLSIIIAWGLPKLFSAMVRRKIILAALMTVAIVAMGLLSARQTRYWKNSITLYLHAIDVTKNNYLALNNCGVAYSDIGRYQDSLKFFKEALKIKPAYADAVNNIGFAYSRLGCPQKAINAFKHAIKIKSAYAIAYFNLAAEYKNLGQLNEAADAYRNAVKYDPENAEAYNNLASVYGLLGNYNEEYKAYQRAIEINPGYHEPYYNLGLFYTRFKKYDLAVDSYLKAIKLKPDDAQAYNNLGFVYGSLGNFRDEIEAYKKSLKIKPDLAETHINLGIAYLAIGDKQAAVKEYQTLKTLNPEFAEELLEKINR